MKLRRFNESKIPTIISDYFALEKRVKEENEKIKQLLVEFLWYNKELLPNDLANEITAEIDTELFGVDNFYFHGDTFNYSIGYGFWVEISYFDGEEDASILFTGKDFENLNVFLENPEEYKDIKKYNL